MGAPAWSAEPETGTKLHDGQGGRAGRRMEQGGRAKCVETALREENRRDAQRWMDCRPDERMLQIKVKKEKEASKEEDRKRGNGWHESPNPANFLTPQKLANQKWV